MRAIERGLEGLGLLSDSLREQLSRRLRELSGVALVLLALALALALATWSVKDPSLSHATNTPMRNMLGVPGAVVADLLMQLFGIASIALVLPIAIWGWRLMTHRALCREGLRVLFWIVGVALAAGCAAALPRGTGWPLPAGLGGVVGDAMIRLPTWLAGGALTGWTRHVIVLTTGLATVVCLALTVGFGLRHPPKPKKATKPAPAVTAKQPGRDDEEEEERAWISLGWLVHEFLSLKARIVRLFAGRPPATPMPVLPVANQGRVEPRFEGATLATLAPQLDDELAAEEDEVEEEDEEPARPAPRKPKPAPRPKKSGGYQLPPLDLLAMPKSTGRATFSPEALQTNSTALEGVLQDFGVRGEIINARPGPVVTLYELEPAPGIKSSRVIGLADDIARSMSAISARVAVVSGRNAIGIELPNPTREKVFLRELLAAKDYDDSTAKLPLCLGKTIGGEPVIVDLARMPHLLIAGTTGSGKSVAINTMILSLLYRLRPEQCRLIMIDPKMLELSVYDGIPHLLTPVVTDPKKAVVALKWAVREMEERYKKMSKLGVRNIDGYNTRLAEAKAKGETLTPHRPDRLRQGDRRGDLREGRARPRAAALHRRHRRRDGRPDDGRRQGHRRRDPAAGADGARRRHPRHPGDPAAVGRRHHRHHQGELPDPHLLPGHLEDRQPHHPGRAGRRAAARPGRHALHGRRRPHQPRPRPLRLRRRGREGRPPPEVAGRAAIPRSGHRGRGAEATRTAPVFDATGMGGRRRDRPLPAGGRRSCCATARPRPATSSAGCRSATTAPPR